MEEETIRLSKLLTQKGLCSRREADRYIEQGQVLVDGVCVNVLGTKVSPSAKVSLKALAKKSQAEKVTIIMNKPVGYVSCQPEKNYSPAVELITVDNQCPKDKKRLEPKHFKKLAVAGRLDIDSKGLLVFTQDGQVAKQLIGQNSPVEKEYFIRTKKPISQEAVKKLTFGLSLDGKQLKRAKVKVINEEMMTITLTEGKHRQIRRMCDLVGIEIRELRRTRIGKISSLGLKPSQWRFLKTNESF